jgi:hypothetical protein
LILKNTPESGEEKEGERRAGLPWEVSCRDTTEGKGTKGKVFRDRIHFQSDWRTNNWD